MFPLALDPRDQSFRTMVALSVALHGALFFLFVLWTGLSKPSPRYIPVAVVDLVGPPGPAFPPARPEARPAAPARAPSRGKAPALPRAKAARQRTAKAEVPRVPKAVHPNTRELSDRIKRMREEKASEENVGDAIRTLRREREARAAISGVRERVAHRVDLSGLRTPPDRVPPPGGGGGATVGVPPEQLEYFRQLYEKVYRSWVLVVPVERRTGAESLVAQVRIKIEKDGRVTDMEMERKSGNQFFDDSVLRAIKRASPLPVPPDKLRGGEDHYEVGFRFRPPKGEW